MAVDVRYMTLEFFEDTISVTVTSTPSVVRKWLRTTIHASRYHLHRLIVGLGVQWFPSRYSGDDPPAATLQLCVGRRCLIFQLLHSETVPNLLRRFLVHPNNIFVGIWNHSDDKKLAKSKHKLVMLREPLDLRLHAVSRRTGVNLQNQRRETIVREVLGYDVTFEEWINKSEWNAYELSDDQVSQACLDAYASFLIGKYIRAWQFCARDFNML